MKGLQCVYDRMWLCPTYIPDLHCSCRPGKKFICNITPNISPNTLYTKT